MRIPLAKNSPKSSLSKDRTALSTRMKNIKTTPSSTRAYYRNNKSQSAIHKAEEKDNDSLVVTKIVQKSPVQITEFKQEPDTSKDILKNDELHQKIIDLEFKHLRVQEELNKAHKFIEAQNRGRLEKQEELKTLLQSKNDEIERLKIVQYELENKTLADTLVARISTQNELDNQNSIINQLISKVSHLETAFLSKETELYKSEAFNQTLTLKISSLESQAESDEDTINHLQSQMMSLSSENSKLKAHILTLKSVQNDFVSNTQIAKLKGENQQLKCQISKMQNQLETVLTELIELENGLKSSRFDMMSVKTKVAYTVNLLKLNTDTCRLSNHIIAEQNFDSGIKDIRRIVPETVDLFSKPKK